jgi:rhamnogalacturonan endolyase
MMFDFDNHTRTHVSFGRGSTVRVVSSTPQIAEMSVAIPASEGCPFNVEQHYLLRRGDSGFYFFITYEHTKEMPACTFEQTRAVIRPIRGTDPFTHYIVDDRRKGPYPAGPVLQTVFDTTWRYQFDQQIHSKYDYSKFIADDLVHGIAGKGSRAEAVGMWLIQPSREYVNGGPLRQELTTHQDSPTQNPHNNIVLWMLAGNHFGGPNTSVAAGQEWKHFYGPAFLYINSAASTDATWEDAKKKAAEEDARWPYAFVHHPDYPLERGTVTGSIHVSSGGPVNGAWIVLAPAGEKDWCMSASGYEFWTKADASGEFTIPHVRPGTYSLHVCGGNQFEDFFQDNIRVDAGTTDLGSLDWHAITHGRTLWQIGTPDRSTQEFKNGLDQRHFTNMARYLTAFPNDVTFTIGKSREAEDWNFAQFAAYVKQPYWSIRFHQGEALAGKGTLTIAFAAFQSPGLTVSLNGKALETIKLQKSGMAFYRSGGQDSFRQTATLVFDAAQIRQGENEIQLRLANAQQFAPGSEVNTPNQLGGAMYDAIRLEVDPDARP